MPRGKKAKKKRKAQKAAERTRKFFSPPGCDNRKVIPPPVTTFEYAATEEEIAALNAERDILIDLVKGHGLRRYQPPPLIPRSKAEDDEDETVSVKVGPPVKLNKNPSTINKPRNVHIAEHRNATDQYSAAKEPLQVKSKCNFDPKRCKIVCEKSPNLEPPVDALAKLLSKIMNFKFDLRQVRDENQVYCQCCEGEGDYWCARRNFQASRDHKASLKIAYIRKTIGQEAADFRHNKEKEHEELQRVAYEYTRMSNQLDELHDLIIK